VEANAFAGEAVEMGRLEPGEASGCSLLALHDAHGVPPLVVGVNEDEVGALGCRCICPGAGQTRKNKHD
jgi:hypothetical protein